MTRITLQSVLHKNETGKIIGRSLELGDVSTGDDIEDVIMGLVAQISSRIVSHHEISYTDTGLNKMTLPELSELSPYNPAEKIFWQLLRADSKPVKTAPFYHNGVTYELCFYDCTGVVIPF